MALEDLLDEIDVNVVLESAVRRCNPETILSQYKVKSVCIMSVHSVVYVYCQVTEAGNLPADENGTLFGSRTSEGNYQDAQPAEQASAERCVVEDNLPHLRHQQCSPEAAGRFQFRPTVLREGVQGVL